LPVLLPHQKTVNSTEAAHAYVSSAAEKSASLPQTPPSPDISHYIKGTHLIIPNPPVAPYPAAALREKRYR